MCKDKLTDLELKPCDTIEIVKLKKVCKRQEINLHTATDFFN